jgi:hypothetical protein
MIESNIHVQILEGRNEDVAKGDDLESVVSMIVWRCEYISEVVTALTFSCRRCFSSFNSRYVRLASTGVLKGFIIFFTATF